MEELLQAWLSVWLYAMAAIGVVLACLMYKHRREWSKLNSLCTLAVVVLVLHVLEEWVVPGGLHYSYNISHGSTELSCYPMNRLTDMITNFGAVVLGCIVLKFWGFRKPAAIGVMLFSAFEVVVHISIGVSDMRLFGPYGMNVVYSPGLITSLFGFLPVSVGLAVELIGRKQDRPTFVQWAMGIGAMFFFCFLLINLPESLLGNSDSPYEFTNRGFYEQYGEAFEADNGMTYFEYEDAGK